MANSTGATREATSSGMTAQTTQASCCRRGGRARTSRTTVPTQMVSMDSTSSGLKTAATAPVKAAHHGGATSAPAGVASTKLFTSYAELLGSSRSPSRAGKLGTIAQPYASAGSTVGNGTETVSSTIAAAAIPTGHRHQRLGSRPSG